MSPPSPPSPPSLQNREEQEEKVSIVDTEMQEKDTPSSSSSSSDASDALIVDIEGEEEEIELSKAEKHENPSEITRPVEDKSLSLALAADSKESGGDEDDDIEKVQVLCPEAGDEITKKRKTWLLCDSEAGGSDEAGTPEEQEMFLREIATFHRENLLEYKPLKFYGQPLNILKLWRAVVKLGGYDMVTTSKLWRQVGVSFHPPKTCTTVSYTFRNFYQKGLLEYEKHLRKNGELNLPDSTLILSSSLEKEASSHQGSGTGRARRDSAARAVKGWHVQRLAGSGEVTEPLVKEKVSTPKNKKLKTIGLQKHKTQTCMDLVISHDAEKQSVSEVVDDGPLADWVKINVKETKDSFEVFVLVPGLLRKEVTIQSDPAGRLVITGEPEQLDNPWGITPFKKIVGLTARIDPLHTSAVMSMHGRLFIRVPFEQ